MSAQQPFISFWLNSQDADTKPSKVIHLPKIGRTLMNGWKSSEMSEYYREFSRISAGDKEYRNG